MRYPWLCALTIRQIESAKDRGKSRKQRVPSRPELEILEQRCLLSDLRTITGFGNNIADPTCGQAGTQPVAQTEAIAAGEMGACFFSNGSCEQLTEGTCEAVGGISFLAGVPCPCPEPQPTDRGESTSDVLTETISGGGKATTTPNTTATAFALFARASDASMFTQSNLSVPSTPSAAAQTPIMTNTDKGPGRLPVGGTVYSVESVAETAKRDTFWQLYGTNYWRTDSLAFLDPGEADHIGLGPSCHQGV
jgi:hypothetical protein